MLWLPCSCYGPISKTAWWILLIFCRLIDIDQGTTYNKSLADSHFLSRIRVYFKYPWQRIQNFQNLNNLKHSWYQALQIEPTSSFYVQPFKSYSLSQNPILLKRLYSHASPIVSTLYTSYLSMIASNVVYNLFNNATTCKE